MFQIQAWNASWWDIKNCKLCSVWPKKEKKKKKEELNQDQVPATLQYGRKGKKGRNILFIKLNEIDYVRLKIDVFSLWEHIKYLNEISFFFMSRLYINMFILLKKNFYNKFTFS